MEDEKIATPETSTGRISYSDVTVGEYDADEEVGQRQELCHDQRAKKKYLGKRRENEQVLAMSELFNSNFLPEDCKNDFLELTERCAIDNLENYESLERGLNHSDDGGSNEQHARPEHVSLRLGAVPTGTIPFETATDTNVKLACICSTNVAVAQIAEKNTLPEDLALLHSVLWNLKQQQLFQMHLLRQLQNQLMHSTGNPSPRPITPIFVPTSLSCSLAQIESASGTSENLTSSSSSGSCPLFSDRQNSLVNSDSVPSNVINNDHSSQQTKFDINSSLSRIKQKTPMLAMMDMSTSYLLQEKILLNGRQYIIAHVSIIIRSLRFFYHYQ